MIESARLDSFEISDYVGVLRRRWPTIVALTFLGALAAVAYIVVAPKSYTATASVYVTPNAANAAALLGNKTSTVVNMDNEVQIVTSASVAKLAARDLHVSLPPSALATHVSVTVPANTQILQISCSEGSPESAAKCAQAFATAYLAAREATARAKISSAIQADQAKEKALLAKVISLQAQLKTLRPGSAAATAAHGALANVSTQLAPLRSAIASLEASTNFKAGYIITAALRPTVPSSPRKLLVGPSGVMVGLLLGLFFAFWADRRDDDIHSAPDVERFLRVPVMLAVKQRPAGMQDSLVPHRSPTGQAFTELARATASALGDGSHVLLVVGASAGTGTSVVAANVAAALARVRSDVVLVCADQRGSLAPRLLGINPGDGRGLAELVAGTAAISDVARPCAGVARLRLILPGIDKSAAEDMPYDASRRAVIALKDSAGYVVIDAGAATEGGTLELAEFADTAIVVAETGGTTRADVADCVRRLDRIRTQVLGAAVLPTARWSAKSARQAMAASQPVRQSQPISRQTSRRRTDPAPMQPGAGARKRPDGMRADQPYGAGSILPDFDRRTMHGQAGDPTLGRGQSWPMPQPAAPNVSDMPGGGKNDHTAAKGARDS
jgi:capsular polysaccharide biosynthesis protein/MinD-like ATPase involved in chromosome partitioning or flagellar assembly